MLSDPKAQIFWMLVVIALGIFSMFSWSSKWSREDHNSYDVMFVYCNSSIDRKECNFRWSPAGLKFYLIPDFAAVKETRCDDGRIRSNGTGGFLH